MWVGHIPQWYINTFFRRNQVKGKDVFFVSQSNYECYRNDLADRLALILNPEQLSAVMSAIDQASLSYEITAKQTDIITVEEVPSVVKYFLASKALENLSEKTLTSYRRMLVSFFKLVRKNTRDITTNDVRCYLAQYKLGGTAADRTIDLYRRILSSFFEWMVNNEYIIRNPCAPISTIKYQEVERQPLTGYDLEMMRASCIDFREKALLDFLFTTGCRVSECAAVRLTDIDWSERSVIIRHGKGDKRRIVFFNAETEVSLRRYIDSRKDSCDSLFVRTRHGAAPMSVRAIETAIAKIRERAHITAKCTPHVIRHTFATVGLRSGMPLERLQMLMGHAKPETTLIYAKQDRIDLQRAHLKAFS